jgi:hypothetical protein
LRSGCPFSLHVCYVCWVRSLLRTAGHACPPGSVVSTAVQCGPGTYALPSAAQCTSCAAGQYGSGVASVSGMCASFLFVAGRDCDGHGLATISLLLCVTFGAPLQVVRAQRLCYAESPCFAAVGVPLCTACPSCVRAAACEGLCAAGYFCPAGSVTATAFPCGLGFLCPEGML